MKDEIILYQSDELPARIQVRVEDETVWLNREQMSLLFGRERTVIGRHISNIFKEEELQKEMVCANFAHATQHGAIKGKTQTIKVEYYNLDVIISVGYRVKSKQGTQFRIWANKVLKDHLLKGYTLNNRINRIEDKVETLNNKIDNIDLEIRSHDLPRQGVFFNGEIFDAFTFVSDLIREAKDSLILIDNYIDDTVLTHFTKRGNDVELIIYTQNISKQLKLDVEKHNKQYKPITICQFDKAHDRFLIIDKKNIYHFGASLKDLGKKWFAFSKLHINPKIILEEIRGVAGQY